MCFKNNHFDNKLVPARYLNRYLSLNSLEEFTRYKLFPNIKEITESMSMFYAVTDNVLIWDKSISRSMEEVEIFVIGDGVVPRTAGLFAFMSKAVTHSIDPKMRNRNYNGIKRLTTYCNTIEELQFNTNKIAIILMPHSHAPIQDCWDNVKAKKKWLLKMPCCTHDKLDMNYYSFRDKYNISKMNEIQIYCNYINLNYENN